MSLKNCYWGKLMMLGLGALLVLPGAASAAEVCVVNELTWCSATHQPCKTADDCVPPGQTCDASGTAILPPVGCVYIPVLDYHRLKDAGVPVALLNMWHWGFINVVLTWDYVPGVSDLEEFDSTLKIEITGEGSLEGYRRTLRVDAHCKVLTGVRGVGDQTFGNEMVYLYAELEGDADFEWLRISAGSELLAQASTGETTLTAIGGGQFEVDSFFDIHYQIDFQGAVGGPLDGYGEIFEGDVRMAAHAVPSPIPAVSEWGMVVMILLVLAAGTIVFRGLMARRRTRGLAT